MDPVTMLLVGSLAVITLVNTWFLIDLSYDVHSICVDVQSIARKINENRFSAELARAEEKLESLIVELADANEQVSRLAGEAREAAKRVRQAAEKLGRVVNAAERLYSRLEEAAQLAASVESEARELQREVAKLRSALRAGCKRGEEQTRQLEELVGRLEEAAEELERVAKGARSEVRAAMESLVRSTLAEIRRMVDSVNGKLGALELACRTAGKRG